MLGLAENVFVLCDGSQHEIIDFSLKYILLINFKQNDSANSVSFYRYITNKFY